MKVFLITTKKMQLLCLALSILSLAHVGAETFLGGVELLGRYNKKFQADWSGSGIRFQATATGSSMSIDLSFNNCLDNCDFYIGVEMNCAETQKFEITAKQPSLHFEHSVTVGETYEFSLVKLTEASYSTAKGIMELGKLSLIGADLITMPHDRKIICPKQYKFLVFGDSLTAAYGVDGTAPCTFSNYYEDVTHGYAFLAAKDLQADIHTVAWSGKGAVRNYGDVNPVSTNPLPSYYNRTLAIYEAPDKRSDNYWEPRRYSPNLVVVMLGSNDYSTEPNPSDEQFTTGLVNFLTQIHADYPQTQVVAMCSPSAKVPNQCANIETAVTTTNSHYIGIPSNMYDGGYGCDSHPNQQTQRNIANYILPYFTEILTGNK